MFVGGVLKTPMLQVWLGYMIRPMERFIYKALRMETNRFRGAVMCTLLDLIFFSPSANFVILFSMRLFKTGEVKENVKICTTRVIEAMN